MKFRRENGECPVDDWLGTNEVSPRDRRTIGNKVGTIEQIEGLDGIPSGWVVDYKTTELQRFAVSAPNKKAVRFLCEKMDDMQTIVLFNGMLKKKKSLPPSKINEAEKLQLEFKEGKGSVEDFE